MTVSTQRIFSYYLNFMWVLLCSELLIDAVSPEVRRRRQALTEDFTKLYHELREEGYFEPSIAHVTYRITELIALGLSGYLLLQSETLQWRILGYLVFSLYFGRVGWLQHEGGHYSLTGRPKVDRFIQTIVLGKFDTLVYLSRMQ